MEKTRVPSASCKDFFAQLPDNDYWSKIYDFDFTTEDNR